MASINYEKYARMSQKQLFNSLLNAEKKERDIMERTNQKLSDTRDLIAFLKAKIKDSFEPKYEFVPLKETQSYKLAMEYKKTLTPQELAEIERELDEEINRDYGDEF
ncbi:hypothetical protein [Helicobacter sp. 23-1045]